MSAKGTLAGGLKTKIICLNWAIVGLKHDEVWEKLRAGIMGETEPLKSLGINMSVANMEAFALSKGIKKSWSEMSQAKQVALRYDYIMEQTANSQGDFAKTSDSLANKQSDS